MGFLSKLKKNDSDGGDLPPPPPSAEKKQVKAQDPTLPPLPGDLPDLPGDASDEMPEEPMAMPEMPPIPEPEEKTETPQPPAAPLEPSVPKAPPAPKQAPPAPKQAPPAPKRAPPAPKQAPPAPKQAPPAPKAEPPKPPEPQSRQQMRSAFSDIPPIKIDADDTGVITKDQVSDLNVDDLVLPGQEVKEPAPKPRHIEQPAPAPQREPVFTGPLYVDVQTYEDVQKAIQELKKQLKEITSDVGNVRTLTEKEDKQFSVVVKKLERIQEDILRVDQDLFEER